MVVVRFNVPLLCGSTCRSRFLALFRNFGWMNVLQELGKFALYYELNQASLVLFLLLFG